MAKRNTNSAEMDRTTFNENLETFVKATTTSQELSVKLAIAGLLHFQKHGDTSYCQEFLDAMPQNYLRKAAFLGWLGDHSPIMMQKGKLKKDTRETANAFDIDGALAKPFYEYKPEPEITSFKSSDILSALKNTLARFKNEKRYRGAEDTAAAEKLAQAEQAITALE